MILELNTDFFIAVLVPWLDDNGQYNHMFCNHVMDLIFLELWLLKLLSEACFWFNITSGSVFL